MAAKASIYMVLCAGQEIEGCICSSTKQRFSRGRIMELENSKYEKFTFALVWTIVRRSLLKKKKILHLAHILCYHFRAANTGVRAME